MSESWGALVRARSLLEIGRHDTALEALAPAMADPETQGEAWCLRTQALIGKGDLSNALPSARKAIGLRPQEEWGHRLLALVLMRGRNHKGALEAAQEAARLSPHQAETQHVLAICQVNRGKKKEAQQTARQLLQQHPHLPLTHLTAGVVASAGKEWDVAERHLRRALELDPDDSDAALTLAEVLKRDGRRREAAEVLMAAGRAAPTDPHVRESIGRIGLPAAGIATFGAVKVLAAFKLFWIVQVWRLAVEVRPAAAVVVAGLVLGLLGGWRVFRRYHGMRYLPEPMREGLASDNRNYALQWLAVIGGVALSLAVFAAAVPEERGRSLPLAVGLVLFGVPALLAWWTLWVGPRPGWRPRAPRWWPRRRR